MPLTIISLLCVSEILDWFHAFYMCTKLATITLPEGLTTIGDNAFNFAPNVNLNISAPPGAPSMPGGVQITGSTPANVVARINIPSTVTSIGANFLKGALKSDGSSELIIQGTTAPTVDTTGLYVTTGNAKSTLKVYYPAAAKAAYVSSGLVAESDTTDYGYSLDLTTTSPFSMLLHPASDNQTNNTATLTATIPTGMTVTATSSDTNVATVSTDNNTIVVTAVAAGTTTITATLKVGDITVLTNTCVVNVTDNGTVEVIPTVEEPATEVSPSIMNEDDKETATSTAASVTANDTLANASASAAQSLGNSTINNLKAQAAEKIGNDTSAESITLYTQTYLSIQATGLEKDTETGETITSITLDITPMMQIVGSTATASKDIVLSTDDGKTVNAAVVQTAQELRITTPSKITVKLPDSFANKQVYITHKASNGRTYIYREKAGEGGTLTFTSYHGFSPFTFLLTDTKTVATIAGNDSIGYTSLQDAVDAAANGATINVHQPGKYDVIIEGNSKTLTFHNDSNGEVTVTINGKPLNVPQGSDGDVTYTPPVEGTPSYTYPVTLPTDLDHGSVTVAKEDLWATDGEKITVTVTPDAGYMLDELTITDKAGNKVEYTDNGDGTITFTMPAAGVTIGATFVVDPDYEAPTDEPETPTLVQDRFVDVAADAWYRDAVQYVVDNGIMTGTSATTFEPQTATTRAMIVSMLHRLENAPSAEAASFTDVAAGSWYADPVAWAAAEGIVGGYEDNTFQPNKSITREELASILYRYAEYKGLDVSARADLSRYTDAPSPWAYDVMAWANAQGLITGRTATTIDAQSTLTRAECAAIFQRFLENAR